MQQRPILIVVGRQRPHNVLLLAYSLAVGLAFLFGWVPRPRTEVLSNPFVLWWMLGLVASGVIGLLGAFWRGQMATGLMLERSAMLIGAGSLFGLAYTVAQFGNRAIFTVGFCVAWGMADLVRAWQISQDLRSLGRKKKKYASGPG